MQFVEAIQKRRAVNFFDPKKDVSEDLLKQIVETAALTPSSFNLQPWNLIEIRDQGEKSKLRELAWEQPKVSEAPVILVILADRAGWKED
ncbi:MAG: nitroreductase family protein, partial [Thermodesulfobacteriota bacterium]